MSLLSNGNNVPRHTFSVPVTEPSQVGEARRLASNLAQQLGFSQAAVGKVALVATETATNLVKHARNGELLFRVVPGDAVEVEVLALDRGPGITNFERCLVDGFSTSGTPGSGLGAIARQSSFLDVYSQSSGTALVARCLSGELDEQARPDVKVGGVNVPFPGEMVCGDAWAVTVSNGVVRVLMADGLGHGLAAADAANLAVHIFRQCGDAELERVLQDVHAALRSTRGAAVAVAEVHFAASTIRYAGVGNIVGVAASAGKHQNLVSHNGTLGHHVVRVQTFTYPFPGGSALIMHSDGLSGRWSLDAYPGLLRRDPGLLAGVLYRDFKRGRDDATVVVVRSAASA